MSTTALRQIADAMRQPDPGDTNTAIDLGIALADAIDLAADQLDHGDLARPSATHDQLLEAFWRVGERAAQLDQPAPETNQEDR